jgi:hypothetical protein
VDEAARAELPELWFSQGVEVQKTSDWKLKVHEIAQA